MRKVIGIIGPAAAGKDYAATYIAKKMKIPIYQISGEIKKMATERKVSLDRESLIQFGRELTSKYGDDYLAKKVLDDHHEQTIIMVGMRQLGQIDYLRKNSKLTLIGINARPEIRFKRIKNRGNWGDPSTLDKFLEIEEKDDGKSVQRISECMKKADYLIVNEKEKKELEEEIDRILQKEKLD